MTVLVVEDNRDVREGVAQFLRILGYEVATAPDGEQALAALGRLGDQIKLVLLDLKMPVMDGRTFRQRQLDDAALADVPVCLLSAEPDLSARAQEMGAVGFLSKPFDFPELVALVQRLYRE